MRAIVAGAVAGAWVLQRQAELPGMAVLAALVLAALILPKRRAAGLVLAGALAGFAWAAVLGHVRLADSLDPAREGRDVVVTGVVASLPLPVERGARFAFDIDEPRQGLPRRVLLGWYNGLAPEEFQEIAPLRAGERWRFTVRLHKPHGLANPHGFDYEAWLFERSIRATGVVRARPAPERVDSLALGAGPFLQRAREALRERFWDALPDGRHAGVLIALAIGEQSAIEAPEWRVFSRTGVSHLMSISGLHVTMVSGLAAWLVFALWCRVPALALRRPAQKAAAVAGFAAALVYCLISGFAVPAQRTLYMIGMVALALCLGRAGSPSRVLAAALALVLIMDPWAVLAPGFWLSFGAVALIFYVGAARTGTRGWLAQWGTVQWAVTAGLAPLLLVLFQQISVVSPLANAVAIPVISLAVTPLALAGAVLPFDGPLHVAHALLDGLMPFLERLAGWEAAVWQQHAPPPWAVPLAAAGAAWLLAPRGVPSRSLGLVLFVPLFSSLPPAPDDGELWLTVLDVGQGTAVVARTRRHTLLYDAGPGWGGHSDAGSRVVVPFLRGEGVRQLDAMVISHQDSDHAGGARSVLEALGGARVLSSLPAGHPVLAGAAYRIPCHAGQAWDWDGVRFAMLHPARGHDLDPWTSLNERSCVLRIEARGRTALLAGDIGRASELELLARSGEALRADVLLVPHHGSLHSSSPAFVRAVSPSHAVVAAGHANRFGHPRPEVVARYEEAGSVVTRSDAAGATTWRFGATLSSSSHRADAKRYWHGR